jgi:Fe-S-cluster containining protein
MDRSDKTRYCQFPNITINWNRFKGSSFSKILLNISQFLLSIQSVWYIQMTSTDNGIDCDQCGICCKVFGDSISPTIENIYSWLTNDRQDILQHFSACFANGTWKNCAELQVDELGDIITVEMRDPDTGALESACPFLSRVSKKRYLCSIHMTKPEMCDNYKPWLWGETYLKRCRTIVELERRTLWQNGVND